MTNANMGEERRTIQEMVYDQEDEDDGGVPKNLGEAIFWLNEKMGEIPEAYRSKATLVIEDYAYVKIFYERPETDEEMFTRLGMQEAYTVEQFESEKQTLRELIERYPDLAEAVVKLVKERSA